MFSFVNQKAVMEECDTMLQQCSKVRQRILQTYRNVGHLRIQLLEEEINYIEQVNQYLKLIVKLWHSISLVRNQQNGRLYSIACHQIGDQFDLLESKGEIFNIQVELFMDQKKEFETEWFKPIVDVHYPQESMTVEERKKLLENLRKANRKAAEVYVVIQNLHVEWNELRLEMNAGLRNCSARANNLLKRVRLRQGIGEE